MMEITQEQLKNLEAELEKLKILVKAKIRKLQNDMGLSKKYSHRIHQGRNIQMQIDEALEFLKSGQAEPALDKVWDLKNLGLKLKSVSFPFGHKTFRQLRKESILRNPEQLIKRSRSHGEGYRK
ncbi:MAG TPA: hypothetical protein VLA71_03010 [Algoriphagus sp.]|nr:hypothetical protein [Algoriphagus sp.]